MNKIVFLLLSLAICFAACEQDRVPSTESRKVQSLRWELTASQADWVEKTLNSMSVEEKIGQLIAPAIGPSRGDRNDELIERLIPYKDN